MKSQNEQLNRVFLPIDAIIVALSYLLAWLVVIYLRDNLTVGVLPSNIYFAALIIIVPLFLILYTIFGLYRVNRTFGIFAEFTRILESNILGLLIINTILFVGSKNPYFSNFSRIMIFTFGVFNVILEFLARNFVRLLLRVFRKKGFNQKHILLVGYSDAAFKFIDKINKNPGWGYHIFGIVDDNHKIDSDYRNVKVIDRINNLKQLIDTNDFDEVIITLGLNEYDKLKYVVSICEKSGLHTKFIPDYGTIIPTKPVTEDFDGMPVINIRAVPLQNLFNRFIKRTIDIFGSIFGIILFSPVFIFLSIAIKLTSKGPIIFKQERVGLHNKVFTMYKFRSMIEQTDEEEKKAWTVKNDPRTTKIGAFIRKISFDELPQFFNVLFGDMSLVGPRPERKQFVEEFKETIPRYMIKHQVRPGMTGWAQINGLRGDTDIEKRIQYDIWYIENWTLGLDIKILLLTPFFGFVNKNAY